MKNFFVESILFKLLGSTYKHGNHAVENHYLSLLENIAHVLNKISIILSIIEFFTYTGG